MPTENEFKIVLVNTPTFLKKIMEITDFTLHLEQAYIKGDENWQWRIRKTDHSMFGVTYYSTIKIKKEDRLIELEQAIDERDYNDLIEEASSVLYKIRYEIYDNHDQKWEVDFFKKDKNDNNFYFVMAELEKPEGAIGIESVPDFIMDNIIYYVPQEQNSKYSSKNLVDPEYAQKLYNTLLKEQDRGETEIQI